MTRLYMTVITRIEIESERGDIFVIK